MKNYSYFDIEKYNNKEDYYSSSVILNCELEISLAEFSYIMSELTYGENNVNSSLGMFSKNKDNSITLFENYINPIETEKDSNPINWIKECKGKYFNK